jgi:hypothetical protein
VDVFVFLKSSMKPNETIKKNNNGEARNIGPGAA